MNGGSPGEYVAFPAEIVSWFSAKYNCCTVLPRWPAASFTESDLRESTQTFISQFAVNGKRKICNINIGTMITYSIAM
jgi:hypothetical protein